jgi:hypothetical protein
MTERHYACTVRFRARLHDGTIVDGPIQGSGGEIGNASLHLGQTHANKLALERLLAAQRLYRDRGQCFIYEPEPGHVAMFPQWSLESRGEAVLVPLVGTVFTIAPPTRSK